MTAPKPRGRKADRLLSWFSTGHHGARSDRTSTPGLGRQYSFRDPAQSLQRASLLPANLPNRCCPHSTSLSAAVKSP